MHHLYQNTFTPVALADVVIQASIVSVHCLQLGLCLALSKSNLLNALFARK